MRRGVLAGRRQLEAVLGQLPAVGIRERELVDGLRVVTAGLTAEDNVVVNGVRRIFFPGMSLVPDTVSMDNPLVGGAGMQVPGGG